MTSSPPVVLTLITAIELSRSAERVVAAAGARTARVAGPTRRIWRTAAAVVLDEDGARRCADARLPRRDGVFLVGEDEPSAATWAAAIGVGAQQLFALPRQETDLMGLLSEAAETGPAASRRGRLIAVTGGRGGAGASVFAAALAQAAGESLLVDLDPCSGGIDLLLGGESAPGLRWPDLNLGGGRLGWDAVREVLPRSGGVSVLSSARAFHEIDPEPAAAVLDAGRRAGVFVVCDVPRQPTPASLGAVEAADLVIVVTTCDVRGIAAATATLGGVRSANPNVGLVVRGPSPGGLGSREAGAATATPVLAAMRPERMLDSRLETGGLRLGRRSPLAGAARRVLGIQPGRGARAA